MRASGWPRALESDIPVDDYAEIGIKSSTVTKKHMLGHCQCEI